MASATSYLPRLRSMKNSGSGSSQDIVKHVDRQVEVVRDAGLGLSGSVAINHVLNSHAEALDDRLAERARGVHDYVGDVERGQLQHVSPANLVVTDPLQVLVDHGDKDALFGPNDDEVSDASE